MNQVIIKTLENIPLIKTGDNLAEIIFQTAKNQDFCFQDKDVLVIASKIVAKAEGRIIDLKKILTTEQARKLAKQSGKCAALCQIILNEAKKVLRVEPGIIVTEHKLGYVGTSAGVDLSNSGSKNGETAVLLPKNPDASAQKLREEIEQLTNRKITVIISDSGGRADRFGSRGEAVGVAGISSLTVTETVDIFGRRQRSEIALADSVADAANLLMGEAAEHRPAVIVRGLEYSFDNQATIQKVLKKSSSDL